MQTLACSLPSTTPNTPQPADTSVANTTQTPHYTTDTIQDHTDNMKHQITQTPHNRHHTTLTPNKMTQTPKTTIPCKPNTAQHKTLTPHNRHNTIWHYITQTSHNTTIYHTDTTQYNATLNRHHTVQHYITQTSHSTIRYQLHHADTKSYETQWTKITQSGRLDTLKCDQF